MTKTQRFSRLELSGSVLLILFLLWLAANGFLSPVAAASGFGIPLADARDAFYLLVKADRDLASALALGALLWLGNRRALGAAVTGMTIAPVLDACLLLADPRGEFVHALAVHGSAALYCGLLGWRLLRRVGRRDSSSRIPASTASPA